MSQYVQFLSLISKSLQEETFIKISLGNYKGSDATLKNIYGKAALIKRELKLSFTFRHQTKDITKNYPLADGVTFIGDQLNSEGFRVATLFTTTENILLQWHKKGEWKIQTQKPTAAKPTTLSHDHQKERKIGDTAKAYLHELRLTDDKGNVYKNAQDKWKQINHYIELLSTALHNLPSDKCLQIVDMGAGKGYLTFALYDYLTNELKKQAAVVGVEYRADLVELCNQIAERAHFEHLSFIEGTIEAYQPAEKLDMLIALHACDTATDDAIHKGIMHEAAIIVVAPCCHKQVRRAIEETKPQNDLSLMTKHGIFLERHAEMLTDSMRALILEYYGYQTKVMQFIADAHTPKNVMILATKSKVSASRQAEILAQLKASKTYFGVGYHHLERLCGLEKM